MCSHHLHHSSQDFIPSYCTRPHSPTLFSSFSIALGLLDWNFSRVWRKSASLWNQRSILYYTMDSPQSVVSPLKGCFGSVQSCKQNADVVLENSGIESREMDYQGKKIMEVNLDDLNGVLEIYIHEARDIHNICIYQKQDVYAKFSLTNDPENTVSTKIINGGGRNPVFNENLSLNVSKIESSLKCEIWMLSRVRNYLEDQLLGFALVPVSDIFLHSGKLEKEFSLSSTDLFHSPAGFVQLTVSYIGTQPEVVPIPSLPVSLATESVPQDVEFDKSLPCDLEKIEFPDPQVLNENHKMVEEYFAMPCAALDSKNSSDTESSELFPKIDDSPPGNNSANGTSSQSCETQDGADLLDEDQVLDDYLKKSSNASTEESSQAFSVPAVTINIEPEPKLVQQEIVDMYMKSMQQFTESLAKMKLPMDFENGPTVSEDASSEKKSPASKNSGSRVFYGSRAFF